MAKTKVKSENSSSLSGNYTVPDGWVKELNFFDLDGSKAKTQGSSNKFYHIELQVSGSKYQIYTEYGATGCTNPAKEFRFFDEDKEEAEAEFQRIFKAKVKKGYKEIDVAQRAIGSTEAQKQTKAVILKNADAVAPVTPQVSKLTSGQKSIVSLLFSAQDTWVAQTLKCPLGQLTNNQIDMGRDALNKAKTIVNDTTTAKKKAKELQELTNDFYGLIPHNLGSGARGKMTHLLLDSLDKIVQKEADLDTLLDAKAVGAVLKVDSTVDDKYKSLDCDFNEVDSSSPLFKFLVSYFSDTKVNGHGFQSTKVSRIWSMARHGVKETA